MMDKRTALGILFSIIMLLGLYGCNSCDREQVFTAELGLGGTFNGTVWTIPGNFSDLSTALANSSVEDGDIIRIDNATLTDTVNVTKRVEIDGQGNTTLTGGFNISTANVYIHDLNITAGMHIEEANVTAGIYSSAAQLFLEDLNVNDITGQTGVSGKIFGFNTSCYWLQNKNILDNVNCTNITAGTGFGPTNAVGNPGGNVYGLYASDSNILRTAFFTDLTGGLGSAANCGDGTARIGGLGGTGVAIRYSDRSSAIDLNVSDLNGGASGNSCGGSDDRVDGQIGGSINIFVADSLNNFEGIYVFDVDSSDGKSGARQGTGGAGNGGAGGDLIIFVKDSSNFSNNIIKDSAFVNLVAGNGVSGTTGTASVGGGAGGVGGNILSLFNENNRLFRNNFTILTSGNGAAGGAGGGASGGQGRNAGNISFDFGANNEFNYSLLSTWTAGNGGAGQNGGGGAGENGGAGGSGGHIFGLNFSSNQTVIQGNNFTIWTGGAGASGGSGDSNGGAGSGGSVFGMKIPDSVWNHSDSNVGLLSNFYNNSFTTFVWGADGTQFDTVNHCHGSIVAIGNDLNACGSQDANMVTGWEVYQVSESASGTSTASDNYVIEWFTSNSSETGAGQVQYSISYGTSLSQINTSIDSSVPKNGTCKSVRCTYTWNRSGIYGQIYFNVTANISDSDWDIQEYSYQWLGLVDFTLNSLGITPTSPFTNNTLTCSINLTNSGSNQVKTNFTWYQNGTSIQTNNSINSNSSAAITLATSSTSKNFVYNCTAISWTSVTSSTTSRTRTVLNYVPTPTNITYWNGSTVLQYFKGNLSSFNTTYMECISGIDIDGDTLNYTIQALTNETLSGTRTANELVVNFCSPITVLWFNVNLSKWNISDDTYTDNNVSVINVSACVFNATCIGRCPYTLSANLNSTDTTYHHLFINDVNMTNTSTLTIGSVTTNGLLFNTTMTYILANTTWDFNINWSKGWS